MGKKFPTYKEMFGEPGQWETATILHVKKTASQAKEVASKVVQAAKNLQKSK